MIRSKVKSHFSNERMLVLALLLLTLLYPVGDTIVPKLETKFRPAVGQITIINPIEVDGGVLFSATAEKYRDCDWRKTTWYLGNREDGGPLITERPHLDKPEERDIGILTWDEIFVPGVTIEQLLNRTFADAYHSCYGEESRNIRSEYHR